MFPHALMLMPVTNYIAILLPFLLCFTKKKSCIEKENLKILGKLMLVSFGMFFIAHMMLFKLHLPSRYVVHTFRIIIDISAAIVISILLNKSYRYFQKYNNIFLKKISFIIISLILLAPIIFYPFFLDTFPKGNYLVGKHPQTYEFFAQQPKNIMIASLVGNYIPSFSARSVLVSREYAIPYHNGYYLDRLRPKIIDTIEAQYTTDLSILQKYINQYKINFWLIPNNSFTLEY